MSENPARPSQPVQLTDGVDGVDVASTLLNIGSVPRAAQIYGRQINQTEAEQGFFGPSLAEQQHTNPPETYMVRYFVWHNSSQPFPQNIQDATWGPDSTSEENPVTSWMPVVRSDNPLQHVRSHTHRQIQQAFEGISAQLPGRFNFVEVNDPAEADISIAAVPAGGNFGGRVSLGFREMVLNNKGFEFASDTEYAVILHEIGHALGLRHPFGVTESLPLGFNTTREGSNFDTVMTYPSFDRRTGRNEYQLEPLSLMPSDLDALIRLYPIAADHRTGVAQVSHASNITAFQNDRGAELEGPNGTSTVLLPQPDRHGVVYQPTADSANDTLHLRAPTSNASGWVESYPSGNGTIVQLLDKDGTGATLVTLRPERIVLSPGEERVRVDRPTRIDVVPNTRNDVDYITDEINLRVDGNRISLPSNQVDAAVIYARGHGTNHVTVRDSHLLPPDAAQRLLGTYLFPQMLGERQQQNATWRQDEQGFYHVTVNNMSGAIGSNSLVIELQGATEQTHRAFQQSLNQADAAFMSRERPFIEEADMVKLRLQPLSAAQSSAHQAQTPPLAVQDLGALFDPMQLSSPNRVAQTESQQVQDTVSGQGVRR